MHVAYIGLDLEVDADVGEPLRHVIGKPKKTSQVDVAFNLRFQLLDMDVLDRRAAVCFNRFSVLQLQPKEGQLQGLFLLGPAGESERWTRYARVGSKEDGVPLNDG